MPGAGTDKTKTWVAAPGPVVILVEPQLGENIGAAARVMANSACPVCVSSRRNRPPLLQCGSNSQPYIRGDPAQQLPSQGLGE